MNWEFWEIPQHRLIIFLKSAYFIHQLYNLVDFRAHHTDALEILLLVAFCQGWPVTSKYKYLSSAHEDSDSLDPNGLEHMSLETLTK